MVQSKEGFLLERLEEVHALLTRYSFDSVPASGLHEKVLHAQALASSMGGDDMRCMLAG